MGGRSEGLMKRILLVAGAVFGVSGCQPAAAPVVETVEAEAPAPAAPVETPTPEWDVLLDPVLALTIGGDGLTITCEEAKGVLRVSFEPAWEKEGPFDKATLHLGDKAFPVTIDAAAAKDALDKYRPVYVLPADADTVTAVMMANNARLVVTNQDGEQERGGTPTDNGSFDMFGTTCAQINRLR